MSIHNALTSNAAQLGKTSSEAELYSKITWRFIPFFFICYVVAYLDRTNISFAQMQMKEALGFSDAVYGLGAGIFFVGYSIFEVPSNLLLKRIGPRKTFFRIMVLWGAVSVAMIFATTPIIFYVLRFLLGVFEAGFFPGIVYFLTQWYPGKRRGNILALFTLGMPISGLLGGPIAGWVLSSLHDAHGLQGWQWLFLLEGLPAIVLGCLVFLLVDDEPSKAAWLAEHEKATVIRNVDADRLDGASTHGKTFLQAIADPRIYVMCVAYFTFISAIYAIGFWLPTMLKGAGITDIFQIGMYSMIPFGVSALGMVLICRSSDRFLERRWHLTVSAVAGAVFLSLIPAVQSNLAISIAVMAVATTGIYALLPLFWSIPSAYLSGTAAAAGAIALINSVGLTGGLVSPIIISWVKEATGSVTNGLYAISVMLVAGALLIVAGVPARLIRERGGERH